MRPAFGSRTLVRRLAVASKQEAEAMAQNYQAILVDAFHRLRRKERVDVEAVLAQIPSVPSTTEPRAACLAPSPPSSGGALFLKGLRLPNGAFLEEARLDSPDQEAMLMRVLAALGGVAPASMVPEAPSPRPSKRSTSKDPDPLPQPIPATLRPKATKSGRDRLRLGAAIADHLGDLERAGLHSKTILESRHTLRIFAGLVGEEFPIDAIGLDQCRLFLDAIRSWPSNITNRPEYKNLSVQQVLARSRKLQQPPIAAWTLAKHRQRLNVFFVFLVKGRLIHSNPLQGIRAAQAPDLEDSGQPFSDRELGQIFNPASFSPWASKYPHRWFGCILGLYSGARVNEIGQLKVHDVETVDGIPGFHVRGSGEGQRIKNKNSKRFIPLSQPAIDAGFLEYVEEARRAGHVQLFPNLPNSTGLGFGRQLSRQFSVYIKQLGITTSGQGFHGFRHTFATRLDEAGASLAAISALTGHGSGHTVLEKFYIDRRTLSDRVATLARWKPPVVLPPYRPGQFAAALASPAQGPVPAVVPKAKSHRGPRR